MAYKITDYSRNKIAELNAKLQTDSFSIKSSSDKSKKLDVFLFDDKIASVGAIKPRPSFRRANHQRWESHKLLVG